MTSLSLGNLSGRILRLFSCAGPLVVLLTPEGPLQLVQEPIVELVQAGLRPVLGGRRGRALAGALQAALGRPGARPGILPRRHVVGDAPVSRGTDAELRPRRRRQTRSFGLALRHFAGTARARVRTFGYAPRAVGLVDVPVVFDNRHHESHFRT